MKARILILLMLAFIGGCTRTVYYNVKPDTPFDKKATVLLQTKGNAYIGKK
ncbi:hypothetical protein GCM10011297_32050 [Bacterioplanes sanyensis]|nr:hypothetical protein GCM10011297_32050 [Bacterioplanes sanyensis]